MTNSENGPESWYQRQGAVPEFLDWEFVLVKVIYPDFPRIPHVNKIWTPKLGEVTPSKPPLGTPLNNWRRASFVSTLWFNFFEILQYTLIYMYIAEKVVSECFFRKKAMETKWRS